MATSHAKPPGSHYPVLIVGAGINGCGLFRDLALQGVDALLIDKGDVCGGASAASSRLIHGGLKYLEAGAFRLVRESAEERDRLLCNAPHYVLPLETVLPLRTWFSALKAAVGLRVYDLLSRKRGALPEHRFLSAARLRAEHPDLDHAFMAAALYHEARVTHAERLGLELVMDALVANPRAGLRTYTTLKGDACGALRLVDQLTGETHDVTADVVVNAGGAWIDEVTAALGLATRHIGGSKGSHLIVANAELHAALEGRMVYFGTKDGRINLAYPFFGHVLVGSTDIPVGKAGDAACTAEEARYILATLREIFPGIAVKPEQVLLAYCGVRPLPHAPSKNTGAVSRDHSIAEDRLPGNNLPVLSLIGGKWTTFRAFAEQACDRILHLLGKDRRVSTAQLAIGGGRAYPATQQDRRRWTLSLAEIHQLEDARADCLLARYGTRAERVAAFISMAPDRALATLPGYSARELAFLCQQEPTRRLADLLLRRTSIAMEGLLTPTAIAEAGDIAAEALGWDEPQRHREVNHCLSELTGRLSIRKAA